VRRVIFLAMTVGIAGFAAAVACLIGADADGTPGNDRWEQYRAPWPERPLSGTPSAVTRYERYDGCPVGSDGIPPCQYHSTAVPNYRWAIDLNNETDIDHQPCYDVNSDSYVDSGDWGAMGRRCCTSETDPINIARPGYDYDDRYDVNRDGYVDSADIGLVTRQIAHCSTWGCVCR
jgi:hypothetical protein